MLAHLRQKRIKHPRARNKHGMILTKRQPKSQGHGKAPIECSLSFTSKG